MSRWIKRFPKQSLTLCKLSKKMQTFVTNCSIPEEKKLVLGETKKAEHSRKRLPFLTQRKNKPAKKKEENVHATVDIGHNDVDLLRDMVWKKDRRIHDTYLDVKDKNERDAISAFLMIHCGD
ncbi:uncharacterized protein LOC9311208 [Arabidopsis lyrata subsp. lyrata]|uniref:uncharacterized protein LOC9311208 n=1 Tax=Arabidopsis lyrata subsp. lyrata TaxID=81972 RepID=UPI000A29D175|nr:uncharacterized protein LOC9311208 [Arabidopsis lyrata subsp. lyrata]|eukprot:XP_020881309.1 uncharacterized protein LOC9311208 [Arabidopsis lyrata subsp. lyrata]